MFLPGSRWQCTSEKGKCFGGSLSFEEARVGIELKMGTALRDCPRLIKTFIYFHGAVYS